MTLGVGMRRSSRQPRRPLHTRIGATPHCRDTPSAAGARDGWRTKTRISTTRSETIRGRLCNAAAGHDLGPARRTTRSKGGWRRPLLAGRVLQMATFIGAFGMTEAFGAPERKRAALVLSTAMTKAWSLSCVGSPRHWVARCSHDADLADARPPRRAPAYATGS